MLGSHVSFGFFADIGQILKHFAIGSMTIVALARRFFFFEDFVFKSDSKHTGFRFCVTGDTGGIFQMKRSQDMPAMAANQCQVAFIETISMTVYTHGVFFSQSHLHSFFHIMRRMTGAASETDLGRTKMNALPGFFLDFQKLGLEIFMTIKTDKRFGGTMGDYIVAFLMAIQAFIFLAAIMNRGLES